MNKCKICQSELTGKQTKYCCRKCSNSDTNNKNQNYVAQQKRGIDRRLQLINLKGGQCCKCGYHKNISALTFHHTDPNKKDFQLDMRKCSNASWSKLTEELSKCQLLCHNCHNELHHPELDMVGVGGIEPPTLTL